MQKDIGNFELVVYLQQKGYKGNLQTSRKYQTVISSSNHLQLWTENVLIQSPFHVYDILHDANTIIIEEHIILHVLVALFCKIKLV